MFDKLKEMNRLRKLQGDMKKQMEQIFVTGDKGDYQVLIRGDKKIEKILIAGEEDKDLKNLINDTLKELDKKLEKQLKGSVSDMFPGLS